jgi:hypothetical protein
MSPLEASYRGAFTPGEAASRAIAGKRGHYRDVLVHQPSRVVFHHFAFDVFGRLHKHAEELLKRLKGLVSQVELAHDDLYAFRCTDKLAVLFRGR